jgi:cellulose synthase/poly-beta-1,6-N-acetylglucosamine synthase-like glycosyltransferase
MLTWVFIVVFWLSLLALLYAYAGYPVCAMLVAKVRKQPVHKENITPLVTVLIAAYNEEKDIAATIENKLSQDYPQDKLEIIVVSDESEDGTDSIVESFKERNVQLLRQTPRAGKTAALNLAVPMARGEVLVFSDANSIYAPDALHRLVANFADTNVGYVTGKMLYTNPDGSPIGDGCSAYMKYENRLRAVETELGSIVGVDGGIDAMRKALFTPLRADQLPDFVQPLMVVEKGYRVVYEPKAVLWEETLHQDSDEYRMRVRVTLRALWALKDMQSLLWGSGGLLFAWQLWSHKVLRYCCFIFLFLAFCSNVWLVKGSAFYSALFLGQLFCYICAALSPLAARRGKDIGFLRLAYYFILLNVSSLHAMVKFLQGKKQVIWSPRKG